MSILNELHIKKYINAHDTYTIYGSRLSENIMNSMKEISSTFVDMRELQKELGQKIADITGNEAAFITNGASSSVLLCACICMTDGDMYKYRKLPDTSNIKNEIIVMKSQRNAYDTAIRTSGAKVVEIGDADETLEFDLIGSINEKTAGVFYFESSLYKRGSMPIEKVIEVCKKYNIPVVVDAAAWLPPKENFWKFTNMGADMVIFSGGKTLKGPMDSGIIVGKKEFIEHCHRLGFPNHGICRSSKTSKEAMVGLYIALKDFFDLDDKEWYKSKIDILDSIISDISDLSKNFFIVNSGPIGQEYPRLFINTKDEAYAENIRLEMCKRGIYIGRQEDMIYISPLNLTLDEAREVGENLKELLS